MHDQRVDEVREAVRRTYARVAETSAGGGGVPSCWGGAPRIQPTAAESMGYARQDVESVEPCFQFHLQQARKLGVSRPDMMRTVKTVQVG